MAVITVAAALNMRRRFACSGKTIVTGAAGADHLRVIDGENRREHIRRVAVLADIRRRYVPRVFADAVGAVMAANAVARNISVIERCWSPRNRRVTVVAGIGAVEMCGVLAHGGYAVVAGTAGTDHLGVIDSKYRCENVRRVAVLANIAGRNVLRIFAGGIGAVMAINAIARYVQMIEVCGQPAGRRVTVVAGIAAQDVSRRLAGCGDAVMTRSADPDYLGVVDDSSRGKCVRRVTVLANVGRLNMRWRLAGRFGSVVTADAVVGYIRMIEIRRYPAKGSMTIIAVVVARDVCRVLARRSDAVVTGAAGTKHLCVIDRENRCENIRRVAVLTSVGRQDMLGALSSRFGAVVAADAAARDIHMIEIRGQPGNR